MLTNTVTATPVTLPSQLLSLSDTISIDPPNMNFSTFQQIWVRKPWPDIILRSLFVVPILLVGFIGNSAIIYSVCKFKAIRSKPTNLFILNMAIADLAATIVCANAALISDIYQNYVLGSFMCRFEGFIKITCLLVSIHSLVVLSYDRLISIVKPFWPRLTVHKSWIAIIIIWIVSMIMGSPLAYWRILRERQWRDYLEVWCYEDVQYTKYYWLVITGFLIYLPIATMTIVFIVILAQMDRFEANLRRSSTCALQGNSTMKITYRRKIIKMLIIYLLTSIVCWTPFQITVFYRHFRKEGILSPWFFEICFFSQLLASLSSAMNPIIFGFLSEPFRKVLSKSVMFKMFSKVVKPNRGTTNNNNNNKNNGNNENNNHNAQMRNINKIDSRQDLKDKRQISYGRRHTHEAAIIPARISKQIDKPASQRSNRTNQTASFNTLGLVLHNNDQLVEVVNHQNRQNKKHTVQLVDQSQRRGSTQTYSSVSANRTSRLTTNQARMITIPHSDSAGSDSKEIYGENAQAIILGSLNSGLQMDDEHDHHETIRRDRNSQHNSDDNDENLSRNASQSIMSIGFTSIGLSRDNLKDGQDDNGRADLNRPSIYP